MTKLPSVTGKQLLAALAKTGFQVIRIKGSHHSVRHQDGRATVVPVHSGEAIGPGLLTRILRECDLNRDTLNDLL